MNNYKVAIAKPGNCGFGCGTLYFNTVYRNNFITTLVQKKLLNMPPALIIIAQLLMGELTGGWGLVLATPQTVIVIVLVQELYLKNRSFSVIMLLFMLNMYKDKKKNIAIILGSLTLFVSALTWVRTQTPIGDVLYMRAMIPHHSIAILTSKMAVIKDPEVRKLADEIIKAQEKEITEMKAYIERLQSDK